MGPQLEMQPPCLFATFAPASTFTRTQRGCIHPARFHEVIPLALKREPASMSLSHKNMQLHTAESLTEQTIHTHAHTHAQIYETLV